MKAPLTLEKKLREIEWQKKRLDKICERLKLAMERDERKDRLSICGMQSSFRKGNLDDNADGQMDIDPYFYFEQKLLDAVTPAFKRILAEYVLFLKTEKERKERELNELFLTPTDESTI